MRVGMRGFVEGIVCGAWSGWARVACLALCGFWFFVQVSPVRAQDPVWPKAPNLNWSWSGHTYGEADQAAFIADVHAAHGDPGASWQVLAGTSCATGKAGDWCLNKVGYGVTYLAVWQGSCASGWVLLWPEMRCASQSCLDDGGKLVPFEVEVHDGTGACAGPGPTHVCLQTACRGVVRAGGSGVQVSCFGMPAASPPRSYYSGFAQSVTSEPCGASDALASTPSASSTTPLSSSAGGVGVLAGGASVDSSNLARIASNTARIAGLLGESATGGGSSTAACGGPSQPPCNVNLGEVDGDGVGAASDKLAALNSASSLVNAIGNQQKDAMAAAPDFAPSEGRWLLSFAPFTSASGPLKCEVDGSVSLVGQVTHFGFNFCPFVDIVRQVLAWTIGLFTALSLWNLVYSLRGSR